MNALNQNLTHVECPGCGEKLTVRCLYDGRVVVWHFGTGCESCTPVLAEDGGYAEPDDD